MPEKDTIIEGRRPNNANEIALSKQYFENNPSVKIGDKITLPIGDRILNGKPIEPIAPKSKGKVLKNFRDYIDNSRKGRCFYFISNTCIYSSWLS